MAVKQSHTPHQRGLNNPTKNLARQLVGTGSYRTLQLSNMEMDWEQWAVYAKSRDAGIAASVGAELLPLSSPAELLGRWESTPLDWVYNFINEANVDVGTQFGDSHWKWKLNPSCRVCGWTDCPLPTISFFIPIDPMPEIEGLEHGTTQEDAWHVWSTSDGRIALANQDASVVQVLTKKL